MSEGGFVNCVNCVTGGISGERGVPPAEGIALPLREYQPPVVALPPLPPADDPTGPDIERVAIQAEEHAPLAKTHAEIVAGLLRAASPLAGVLRARPCRSCQRGIWVSPSAPGPHPPDLCAACRWARTDP